MLLGSDSLLGRGAWLKGLLESRFWQYRFKAFFQLKHGGTSEKKQGKNTFKSGKLQETIWVFPKIGGPQNGRFIMDISIKMDDLGGKPAIFGNIHIEKPQKTKPFKSKKVSSRFRFGFFLPQIHNSERMGLPTCFNDQHDYISELTLRYLVCFFIAFSEGKNVMVQNGANIVTMKTNNRIPLREQRTSARHPWIEHHFFRIVFFFKSSLEISHLSDAIYISINTYLYIYICICFLLCVHLLLRHLWHPCHPVHLSERSGPAARHLGRLGCTKILPLIKSMICLLNPTVGGDSHVIHNLKSWLKPGSRTDF